MSRNLQPGVGLFGINGLRHPQDFIALAQDTLARCQHLAVEITNAPADTFVVESMDQLSNEICKTFDAAECCRNIHSDAAWRRTADSVCQTLGEYIAQVNQHQGMYLKLQQALPHIPSVNDANHDHRSRSTPHQHQAWRAGEAHLVARRLLDDFQSGGVGLQDPDKRQWVEQLAGLNHHFPVLFNRNLTDSSQVGSAKVHLPGRFRAKQVPLDSPSVQSFLVSTSNEAARRQVWKAAHQGPASNLHLLDRMIAARHQMAQLLGSPSYCHLRAGGGTLAEQPAAVVAFLQQLSEASRPAADRDMAELAKAKALDTGQGVGRVQVGVWDMDHYMAKVRGKAAGEEVSGLTEYLVLEGVLGGLQELVQQLLGVELRLQSVAGEEGWAPDLLKFEASHPDLGPLGCLYLDLATRPGKGQGSMLFPIRCGKELSNGEYQTPILVLCSDFGPAPTGGVGQLVLTWRDLRVLLHEMGHALHNLCSRTTYQHLWGTRCAVDLMEVPSHLAELFLLDHRTAGMLMRSRGGGGRPVPWATHRRLVEVQDMFGRLELQGQVLLALVDQHYFGPTPPPEGQTSEVWHRLATEHSSLQQLPGSCPQARFAHLALYGATYYSYLYARCMSASIWHHYGLDQDPVNPAAGDAIRQLLFEPGGAKEPHQLVDDLLGPSAGSTLNGGWAPSPDAYLNRLCKT